MQLYEKLVSGDEKLALVGLGYVGMPIAVAFSKKVKVVGFDLNAKKIELYKNGIDPTNEVGNEAVKNCSVEYDGFAIQQVLHAIPKDDTSYADTILDFFTTCVPYYIEKHRES